MIYKFKENRVWRSYAGGKRIDEFYGKQKCEDSRRPEEWIASAVEAFNPDKPTKNEGLSICEDGSFFRDILLEMPEELLGKELCAKYGGKQSILVKLLDSAERLVIQCHPTTTFAREHFNSTFGKTECWYMLDCEQDACVYLGFKPGITKEKWIELFKKQDTEGMLSCLHKFSVKKGDLWFVAGGVPHAIGGGCFMIELQEPSDLMVIPERITPSGVELSEQKLHGGLGFEIMFDCFEYTGYSREEMKRKYHRKSNFKENEFITIAGSDLTESFLMKGLYVCGAAKINLENKYAIVIATEGKGQLKNSNTIYNIEKSNSFFVSANSGELEFTGDLKLIFCIAN